ncbi:hypothetical protein GALMADRAFT_592527 [Galerina marginata CBS 339.88]|uniref:Uncharacterized protein n=1 Tax=Galerina marginata (strain CBS 339.88) TaxID=685588 RepID=A0A067T492_GALM3|nr:hypothetical protein GALMADRAFT_592527 [Galerina marginata CBS 339.88]
MFPQLPLENRMRIASVCERLVPQSLRCFNDSFHPRFASFLVSFYSWVVGAQNFAYLTYRPEFTSASVHSFCRSNLHFSNPGNVPSGPSFDIRTVNNLMWLNAGSLYRDVHRIRVWNRTQL